MALVFHAKLKRKKGSNTYTRVNRQTYREYLIKREEGYQYTRTEEQAAMRRRWAERSKAVAEWMRQNCSPPTEAYLRAERAFRYAQSKGRYKQFRAFLMAYLPI